MTARRALPVHGEPDLEAALAAAVGGEVRFDAYTRHLYSTDASMYAIEPIGVVFPRDADDVVAAVAIAARFAVPVLPRGAGTSLGGQTVGRAVVLDFSRFMHHTIALDAEARTARVQPGLVQDELNVAASPHGLFFAPDTSTSNRATLGGMIGNNSCGARSARYGMTIDHVAALEVVLSDGSRARLAAVEPDAVTRRGRGAGLEGQLYREVPRLVEAHADAIRTGFPPYWRRSGGYRLERMLPESGPFDLSKLVTGSEGTLAVVVEATVRLVPRPGAVAAVAGHFETVDAAIAAVEDARACDAAAIELVDRMILDLARRSPVHGSLASALTGDPGALLWVEFYGTSAAAAGAAASGLELLWRKHGHGYAVVRAETATQQKRFRELRKAGLGLLMAAGEGRERSVAFVEDTAVDPAKLPEYTRRFARILERHGLRAGFYGHASAGCLHVRPFMDLRRPGEIDVLRAVAEEVSALVAEFGGMNSSEHGDGLVRAEFSRRLFGDELYETMREVKRLFDPDGRLNPGKKVDSPRMTENIREPALPPAGPLVTHFAFAGESGMRGEANRCMRIGACRRTPDAGGTMCPSFMATREEQHSTRGRANALVRALSVPDPKAALADPRLHEILDLCLECKACKTECPLSVDMATLKSEFLAHYYETHGVPLQARIFGHVRALNRLGAAFAPLSNALAAAAPVRALIERFAGIDRRRPLPRFRRDTLLRWSARRARVARRGNGRTPAPRGPVCFLADSFTSYTEPDIGRAAIELLERAGHEVRLTGDVCCGRALISKGLLKEAKAKHAALLDELAPAAGDGIPIVGCEPSCVLALRDELPALMHGDPRAAAVARQTVLVEELLGRAIDEGALELDAAAQVAGRRILFHPHCHQRAASATAVSAALLERIPGAQVVTLDAGCCGMAGSFGFEAAHYDLSLRIGGLRLFPALAADPEAIVAATGVSCRQQIAHGTGRIALHPVALVRAAVRRDADGQE
jgi:FAD/FMN-containing dehydrogenase/Fe-S oxidoreductase